MPQTQTAIETWRATMVQGGTSDPTYQGFQNTTEENITWTRVNVGIYQCTLSKLYDKVTLQVSGGTDGGTLSVTGWIDNTGTNTVITVETLVSGVHEDNYLTGTYVQIDIYNI